MPLPIGMVAAAGAASAVPCLVAGCSYSQAVMPVWGRAERETGGACQSRLLLLRAQAHQCWRCAQVHMV